MGFLVTERLKIINFDIYYLKFYKLHNYFTESCYCILCNDRKTIGSELDIYFPSLRIAVELNGPVHYEPIYGDDRFERVQNKDKQKLIECYKQGIELIIIDVSKMKRFTPIRSLPILNNIINIINTIYNRNLVQDGGVEPPEL